MKLLLLLFGFICSTSVFAQKKLIGTTVLTASENNMNSRWIYGLSLDSISASDCKSDPTSESPPPSQINSVVFENDSTLVIDIQVKTNCCYSFLGETEILGDTLLNLIYHGYGGYCTCDCCFGLTYTIHLYTDKYYDFQKIKKVTMNRWNHLAVDIPWSRRKKIHPLKQRGSK